VEAVSGEIHFQLAAGANGGAMMTTKCVVQMEDISMVRPRKIREREVLFIDPGVSDIDTLVGHLRTEVEPTLVGRVHPAARQMAQVLAEERDLAAIHIIAHGTSGQVCFTSGGWSVETLPADVEHLAAIGRALAPGGDLRLWSCETGADVAGGRFVTALAEVVGANVSAATSSVGAASLGGTWDLEAPAGALTPLPPLTPAGLVRYAGTLPAAEVTVIDKLADGNPTETLTYFIIDTARGAIVG
jgi:hypothetical protein